MLAFWPVVLYVVGWSPGGGTFGDGAEGRSERFGGEGCLLALAATLGKGEEGRKRTGEGEVDRRAVGHMCHRAAAYAAPVRTAR